MSTADNASIVRRWFAEYNRGNLAVAGELVAPDLINHDAPPDLPPGREGYLRYIADVRAGLPDLRVTIEDLLADGDRVAVRLTLRGTHRGDLSGLAPTGKQVTLPQLNLFRLAGGRIVERWAIHDSLALLQQLGVLPAWEQVAR